MSLFPAFDRFIITYDAGQHQTIWTELVSDTETPVSAMLKLCGDQPNTFLLESIEGGEVRGRYSIIGRQPDLIWRCDAGGKVTINRHALTDPAAFVTSTRAPFDDLAALLAECRIDAPDQPPPVAAGLFGYLGYEIAQYMERLPEPKADTLQVPEAVLIRPTLLAIFDQIENKFTLVTPVWHDPAMTAVAAYAAAQERLQRALADLRHTLPSDPVAVTKPTPAADPTANQTEASYTELVVRAKDYIRAGDIFQVVLSQRFSLPFAASALDLYRVVRRVDPSPFLYVFNLNGFGIVGSSPEILVRMRDGTITIRPIAGTRPRGGGRSDDDLKADLLADPKELAEHLMLLDLGRNDVGRCAEVGSVRVTACNTIETYRHVMHIVSNVEGRLSPRHTALDALQAGFPAGTVSGAPKIRAMEIINELEPDRRGIYGGCVGYFGSNGAMDTAIAIRTAVIKNGTLHMQAGAGIVADSDPAAEYRECVAKARGMLRAAEEVHGARTAP